MHRHCLFFLILFFVGTALAGELKGGHISFVSAYEEKKTMREFLLILQSVSTDSVPPMYSKVMEKSVVSDNTGVLIYRKLLEELFTYGHGVSLESNDIVSRLRELLILRQLLSSKKYFGNYLLSTVVSQICICIIERRSARCDKTEMKDLYLVFKTIPDPLDWGEFIQVAEGRGIKNLPALDTQKDIGNPGNTNNSAAYEIFIDKVRQYFLAKGKEDVVKKFLAAESSEKLKDEFEKGNPIFLAWLRVLQSRRMTSLRYYLEINLQDGFLRGSRENFIETTSKYYEEHPSKDLLRIGNESVQSMAERLWYLEKDWSRQGETEPFFSAELDAIFHAAAREPVDADSPQKNSGNEENHEVQEGKEGK
jgi:hypothetical protein